MLDLLSDVLDLLAALPWEALGIGAAILVAVITVLAFVRVMLIARNKRRKRENLGELLLEGQALSGRCANEEEPTPLKEADAWDDRAEAYLAKHLGSDYVASYRNAAGLPTGFTTIQSRDHRNLSYAIGIRLARLQQFLEELRQ